MLYLTVFFEHLSFPQVVPKHKGEIVFRQYAKKEGGVSNLSIKPKTELVLWKAPPSEEDNVNKNICENELRYLLCIQDEGRMR